MWMTDAEKSQDYTFIIVAYKNQVYVLKYVISKVHQCRFEILSICSCSFENNTLKISF